MNSEPPSNFMHICTTASCESREGVYSRAFKFSAGRFQKTTEAKFVMQCARYAVSTVQCALCSIQRAIFCREACYMCLLCSS